MPTVVYDFNVTIFATDTLNAMCYTNISVYVAAAPSTDKSYITAIVFMGISVGISVLALV